MALTVIEAAGPIFVGILLNWALYGVLVVQVYIYWTAFPSDQWHTKTLVYSLFLLDSLQSILLAWEGFAIFAKGFGTPARLNDIGLVWFTVPILSAIVSVIVECFFAYRIWVLSGRSPWVPAFIVATSFMQGTGAVLAGIKAMQVEKYSFLQAHAKTEITIWHIGSMVCDVVIAISMCYYLWKRDTGFKRTHTAIIRLIELTIETGTVTAGVAIIDLVLFSAGQGKAYYIAPAFVLAKLYANSVIVIFNNRAQIMSRTTQSTVTNVTIDNVNRLKEPPSAMMGSNANGPVHFVATGHTTSNNSYQGGIEIQKSVAVWRDEADDVELSSMNKGHMDSV